MDPHLKGSGKGLMTVRTLPYRVLFFQLVSGYSRHTYQTGISHD